MRPKKHDVDLTSVTVRISEQHKFLARLMARTRGEPESTAYERAIDRLVSETPMSRNWREIWDRRPAIRDLRAYTLPEYKPSTSRSGGGWSEGDRVEFIFAHGDFFYSDKARTEPHEANATILWEHLDEMVGEWMTKRTNDYFVAAKKMATLLKKAQLDPPSFGGKAGSK